MRDPLAMPVERFEPAGLIALAVAWHTPLSQAGAES